jgi:hypothetical protein
LWILRRRDPFEHAVNELEQLTIRYRFDTWSDVLGLDLPAGGHGLADQRRPFDDERTFLRTRTAAPQEAPQSLDLRVGEGQWFAQSADRACSTNAVNVAGSVTAMSASTLRSTSMPAAFRPAMKRL